MRRAGVRPDQSPPCQNSLLGRPKRPPIAALSGLRPLAGMLLVRPLSSQVETQPGQRWWPPRSERMTGRSPGVSRAQASPGVELAGAAPGRSPAPHATTEESRRPPTADRQAFLPGGGPNSAMPVSHGKLGGAERKSRRTRSGGAGVGPPAQEP